MDVAKLLRPFLSCPTIKGLHSKLGSLQALREALSQPLWGAEKACGQ